MSQWMLIVAAGAALSVISVHARAAQPGGGGGGGGGGGAGGGRAPTVDVIDQARKPRPGSPTPGSTPPPAGVPAAPSASPPAPAGPSAPSAPAAPSGASVSGAPAAPTTVGGYVSVPAPQGVPSGQAWAAGYGPSGGTAPAMGGGIGGARAPHVLASEDVERPLRELKAQMHEEPVSARVEALLGSPGEAEWRVAADGGWTPLSAGQSAEGVIEVRTGLWGGGRIVLSDGTTLDALRLSRATIRTLRVGDDAPNDPAARRVVVNLRRGKIVVRPAQGTRVTIVTPDWIVAAEEPTEVTHDAQRRTAYRVVGR